MSYQAAYQAIPVAVPDNSVFSVYDLAFMLPEFRDAFGPDHQDRLARRLLAAARLNPRWLCISHSTAADLIRICGISPTRVAVGWPALDAALQHPITPEERRACRKRLGLEEPFILHVGTLQPRKNIVRLIDACEHLRQVRGHPVQLVLVGQRGWLDEPVLEAIRKASTFVRYLGSLPDQELRILICEARMLAIPSLYEGFGFLALEGMALGTPVAAANVSSLPEVVGDAGILFDPLSEEAIAAALERLWTDPDLRHDLSQRGKARAEGFNWQSMVDALGAQFAAGGFTVC